MEERRRVVLFGRTGSGKSTIANMLVQGSLDEPLPAPIGHGVSGTTVECKTLQGRGWTVLDTVGLGEASSGTVPDEDARKKVFDFLTAVKGRYSHLIYVIEKDRLDIVNTIIWSTFLNVFQGAEKHFLVLYTKTDDDWLKEVMPDIQKEFSACSEFACVDFPAPSQDEEEEKLNRCIREEELSKLEKRLNEMVLPDTWVTPDISNMNVAETQEKAEGILRMISRLLKKFIEDHGIRLVELSVTIFVNVVGIVASFNG